MVAASFFFYDLETSSINPRTGRIMQFAGQRTDMDFKPIGEPVNILVKLTPDVVPEPDAIMVTGITPQATLQDGVSEAEFLKQFYTEVVKPETTFVGFNSVRFDDEFMRFTHYRNFYDAYEWQWCDDCSRWDILDLIRMTRALKPEGIEWPFTPDGKPTNRLELLTKLNGLEHLAAHDALSDVGATIAVAKLIKNKQPQLFDWLLNCRGKAAVKAALKDRTKIFTYTSGRYPAESLHTTAAVVIGEDRQKGSALIYDLRHNPAPYLDMSVDEIVAAWQYSPDNSKPRFPVKALKYNHCPAVVPGYPKDKAAQKRLRLAAEVVQSNLAALNRKRDQFAQRVEEAYGRLDEASRKRFSANETPVDQRLYDGFFDNKDKETMRLVRQARPAELNAVAQVVKEPRLQQLLPLYKARNFPETLASEERQIWDDYCRQQTVGRNPQQSPLARYFKRLQELAAGNLTAEQEYLVGELQLYGESLMPADSGE